MSETDNSENLPTKQDPQVQNVSQSINHHPGFDGVTSCQVPAGSILVLRLGDPATGYVPSPETEKNIRERFEAAFKKVGVDVPIVTVPHSVGWHVVLPRQPGKD